MKINKYLLIPVIILIVGYYFFFISGHHYFFDDVYVYLAYSESLYESGIIRDFTTSPSTAPITVQNGIVLIYTFLRYFTDDMTMMVHILSSILTLNLMIIFFLIYKIGQLLKINNTNLYVLIVALLFGYYFYGYYVLPTNDGFYASLSLLAIYITLLMFEENKKSYMLYMLFIALLLPLFRLQGLVIFIAGFLTFLIIRKQYKNVFLYIVLLIISYFSVKVSIYLLINDFSGLEKLSRLLIIYHFDFQTIAASLLELLSNAIPSMFLNFPASRLDSEFSFYMKIIFSSISIIFLLISFFLSIRDKNYKIFFIILIIFGNFLALMLFNVIIDRYIYLNLSLMLLVLLSILNDQKRTILVYFLLFFNIFTFMLRLYFKQYDYQSVLSNIEYINQNVQNYHLISEMPRQTYFYLHKPSNIKIKQLPKNTNILIIGTETFVKEKLTYLKQDFGILNQKSLPIKWSNGDLIYKTIQIEIINKELKE